MSEADEESARRVVTELVSLLVDHGAFDSDSGLTAGKIERLRAAFLQVGAELDVWGRIVWADTAREPDRPGGVGSLGRAESARRVPVAAPARAQRQEDHVPRTTVFLVHGHDATTRDMVEAQVRRWIRDVNVVILDLEASRGNTLVEKFERHAATASFCVVIATPDDEGRAVGTPTLRPRARQNVILEMGYFFAKLGRGRVVFMDGGVEHPSDISGIVYVSLGTDGWRRRLASEMDAAGIKGDWLR